MKVFVVVPVYNEEDRVIETIKSILKIGKKFKVVIIDDGSSDRSLKILKKKRYKITRIHEGGDFYSKEYILKWFSIINSLPDHIFYAYTKRDDLFTSKLLKQQPKNLILIYSMDGVIEDSALVGDVAPLFNKVSIVRESKHTCPSTSKDNWKTACIRNCKLCIDDKTKVINFARH